MKGKLTTVALGIVGAIILVLPSAASGATLVVNDDPAGNAADVGPPGVNCAVPPISTTINGANAIAVAGDTIAVCSGNYGATTLTKRLRLLGAQADVDARTRAVPAAQESVINPTLAPGNFAGTVFNGFTVTGDGTTLGLNFGGTAVGNTTIVNNILTNHRRAIQLTSASSPTQIAFNRFSNNGKSGTPTGAIYTGGPLTGVTIEQNLFDDTAGPSGVIQINPTAPNRATGLRITDNEFTNLATNGLVIFESDAAVISGNSFVNGNSAVIFLGGENIGTQVTGNSLTAGTASGISLSNAGFVNTNSGVTISGNTITGRTVAVGLANGGHTGGALTVTKNRFVGNTSGVTSNHPTEPVSAVNNWWGCALGPGSAGCDPVTGTGAANVDFDPWMTLTLTASPTSIPANGSTSTVTADLNLNSDGVNVGTLHPDGFPVAWSTDLGTIAPPTSPLAAGVATATLTSGGTAGVANPAATVDNGTVSTPVVFTDVTPPATQIDSGPADGSTIGNSTPTFTFSSPSDPGTATFECSVDGAAFADCTSPYTTPPLLDGSHTFSVRAEDSAGNYDPNPPSRAFTVDTTGPETAITSGPTGGVTIANPTATFAFDSPNDPAATFECRLDSANPADWSPCTSPFTTPTLADGAHVFEVRAVDALGNPDPSPARGAFVVDTTPDPPGTAPGAGGVGGTAGEVAQSPPAGACGNRIRGSKGPNKLQGTERGDRILGLGAGDTLEGRGGFDCLKGHSGDDEIDGGLATDLLQGGPGDDSLSSRDGKRDKLNCGPGEDTAVVDQRDVVKGCETLRVQIRLRP